MMRASTFCPDDIKADAAEAVVEEIRKAGGQAVASADDITSMDGAARIVQAGVLAFGDVHGVVNNAGIVRDRMFASLTEEDWDLVIKVHLKGHFCIASHLVHRWRDQSKAGQKVDARIINTESLPPSTSNTRPVTCTDSGLHSHTTSGATFSGA